MSTCSTTATRASAARYSTVPCNKSARRLAIRVLWLTTIPKHNLLSMSIPFIITSSLLLSYLKISWCLSQVSTATSLLSGRTQQGLSEEKNNVTMMMPLNQLTTGTHFHLTGEAQRVWRQLAPTQFSKALLAHRASWSS